METYKVYEKIKGLPMETLFLGSFYGRIIQGRGLLVEGVMYENTQYWIW